MAANIYLDLPNNAKMPAIGLGTWQVKEPAELEKSLNAALEAGYRHIDTAYAYQNEAIIGKVLEEWMKNGKVKREELFITTKLPLFALKEDLVGEFMQESLKDLRLDYVDLYLIHFPAGIKSKEGPNGKPTWALNDKGEIELDTSTDHASLWKGMEQQVELGRAKAIGISNFNEEQIERLMKTAKIKPANLQVELHVFFQQPNLIECCKKHGITVVAYSPLASPGYNKFRNIFGMPDKPLPSIMDDPVICRIATKHKHTPAQVALRYLLQIGIAAIPKSVTPKRIQENIGVFDFQLDQQDMKALKELDRGKGGRLLCFEIVKGIEKHPEWPWGEL